MRNELQVGVAKVDITPASPIPLAGFAHRIGPYESITRPIYARILVFGHKDQQGKTHHVILVSADLIWWGTELVSSLKQSIEKEWGIAESSILLHGTHNHSGPQTSTNFTVSLGEPSSSYLTSLEKKVLQGIRKAFENVEPVNVESAEGTCEMGIYRRKWVDGEMRMSPNPEGPVDPELTVVRFQTADTYRTKAALIHYTCHPTTTGDAKLSSEYCGYAMDTIESYLGEHSVAAFLQGCCGDVRPALVNGQNFYRGTDEDVRRLGELLATHVISLMEKPMNSHIPELGLGQSLSIPLKLQSLPTLEELKQQSTEPGIVGEWAQGLIARPEKRESEITLEITYIKLTDQLSLISFNSEMVLEYGLFIKNQFPGVLPVPYTNGMIGYIPTKMQLDEGGYESAESTLYFGLPSRFDHSIENVIKETISNLIEKENLHG